MAELEARRDVTIRLLYFSLICQRFQEHHRAQLEEATAAAGVVLPDLSTLTRAEVLDFISTLEAAGASGILSLLQQGLRDLSPAIIPTSWV
jgi:tryptophan synthase alpha subunit